MGSTLSIVGVIFVFTGIIFFIIGLIVRRKVKKAQGWPVVSGTVESTEIKKHKTTTKQGRNSFRTSYTYEPVVNYTYAVNGQTYASKRLAYSGFQGAEVSAQEKLEQYPLGGSVQVHYNPKKPQDALLEVSMDATRTYNIMGLIFIVVGVISALVGVVTG